MDGSEKLKQEVTRLRQQVAKLKASKTRALQAERERYERLLGSVTDYAYTVRIENGQPVATTHGPGSLPVTGYSSEEYAAEPLLWHLMVYDEDKQAVTDQAARLLSGERGAPLEHRIIHKDGSIRWVKNTPVSHYDEHGRLVAYNGLISDITARKQAEEALRESEEKYRSVVEASTDAIFLETLDGRLLDCNAAACELYGYTKEEITRLNAADLIPEDIAATIPDSAIQELANGQVFLEIFNKRKNGQIFPCELNARLITMGGEQRVIVYIHDITRREQAEDELRRAHAELEQRVRDRTDDLTAAVKHLEQQIYERQRVEQALKESEARYRNLVERVPVITYIATLGEANATLYVSPQVEALTGYSQSDCENDPDIWRKRLHPDDRERVTAELFRACAGGEAFSSEYRLLARDGRVVWFRDEAMIVHDEAGQALFLQGVRSDITQRRQAEESLDRRATQLAMINTIGRRIAADLDLEQVLDRAVHLVQASFNYHHVGIFVVNHSRQEAVLKAVSSSYSTHLIKDHRLKLHEGMVGWVATHGQLRLSNDVSSDEYYVPSFKVTQAELSVPLKVGETLIGVLDVQSPQRNGFDDSDVMALETLADQIAVAMENARLFEQAQTELGERTRAEETLRRRNKELTAYNEIARIIGQSHDLGHILNVALDTVLELIGMEAGWIQLAGTDGKLNQIAQRGLVGDMTCEPEELKLSDCVTAQVMRLGEPVVTSDALTTPCLNLCAVGQSDIQALIGIPIKSKESTLGVLGACSYSPRESSPHEMQLLRTIGQQIGIAIENVQLAEKAAEIEALRELDRLRAEWLANVSHELRTPLGLIKIFCTTLLRQDVRFDEETQLEFLHDINQETDTLQALVDNLLDLSRLQSGRLHLDKQALDVGQLVGNVMHTLEVQLSPKHYFVHDFPVEPLVTAADSKRLEEVLRNLLNNAVKYSPEGGAITVRGHRESQELLIQVSDHGIGIAPEDVDKIFERFYRINNETTQQAGGVGLGLAVCKSILEAHGGRIWVESAPGQGSTFCFTLPLLLVTEQGSDSPDRSVDGEANLTQETPS
jgi:PAS domain S-box-containing protein